MIIIAIKNKYMNMKGMKKVKVLTLGKSYELIILNFPGNRVKMKKKFYQDDIGNIMEYDKNLFIDKITDRQNKLEQLGI